MNVDLKKAQARKQKAKGRKRLLQAFSMLLLLPLMVSSIETPEFVSAAELREIERRGKLVVAVKDNLPPLGFRDASGNLQGLEIDIAKRLAQEIFGNSDAVEFQPVANRDRVSAVLDGRVNIAIAKVTATSARSRVVDMSNPYYLDGAALITRDARIQRQSDLARSRIALLNGSSTIAPIKYALPNAVLVGVGSYEQGRSLLESGEADAFAADATVLAGWIQQYPNYRLVGSRLSTEALAVVMPRGLQYDPLRQEINAAIARWQANGWLKERADFWGLL